MTRQVQGLAWARVLKQRPDFIPASRPRGTKAMGLRYERLVAKALPQAKHGVWFEYQDRHGKGWCQTDLLLALAGRIFVLEIKLTDTPEAYAQLQHLYLPVVELALQRPTFGLVVAKNLTSASAPGSSGTRNAERGTPKGAKGQSQASGASAICSDLAQALAQAAAGSVPLLHWLGRSPLITPNSSAGAKATFKLALPMALA